MCILTNYSITASTLVYSTYNITSS